VKFTLTIDVAVHEHSPRAHRHFVGQMLDQVKQTIGSGETVAGDIVAGGAFAQKKIGAWSFTEDPSEKNPVEELQQVLGS
jgi:hypothetical protein